MRKSLELFQEIASSYTIGRTLLKLDIVEFILQNHSKTHFPFLEVASAHLFIHMPPPACVHSHAPSLWHIGASNLGPHPQGI